MFPISLISNKFLKRKRKYFKYNRSADSARLGYFQKSGDSLAGRYFSYQLFPLGLPEVTADFSHILDDCEIFADGNLLAGRARKAKMQEADEAFENLLKFGGFPEPFLKGTEKFHRRWQNNYRNLLTKEDVRDLSRIADIKGLETLVEIHQHYVPYWNTKLNLDSRRPMDVLQKRKYS